MAQTHLFFRIVYGSTYFLLYVILLGLLLITPGDAIERSISNRQQYNVWILIVFYVVTIVIVIFVYLLRLYVNKTVLASIPKSWVPIDKGDVSKAVYKMIYSGLSRSAAIAYAARPRVKTVEDTHARQEPEPAVERHGRLKKIRTSDEQDVAIPLHSEPWGEIEHAGWSSPNSADLQNLQYSSVLSELPNLIEARALTLAPPDPTSTADTPMLDPEAAGLLQRAPHLSLRGYVASLAELGVLDADETTTDFLQRYEHARFSTKPLSLAQFKQLMHLFAEVLRSMQPLSLDELNSIDGADGDYASFESDIDSDAPLGTDPSTPRSRKSRTGTLSSQSSVRRLPRGSSLGTRGLYSTAPNTPMGRYSSVASHKSSADSFAQSRRPYPVSQPSSSSLRSKASSGTGSVIRLATQDDPGDSPYVIIGGDVDGK